jgi:hypothetical protein
VLKVQIGDSSNQQPDRASAKRLEELLCVLLDNRISFVYNDPDGYSTRPVEGLVQNIRYLERGGGHVTFCINLVGFTDVETAIWFQLKYI